MCTRARPLEGLGGAALEDGVLQIVSEPTLPFKRDVCVLVTRAYGAWRVWTRVWSHGMVYVSVLGAWTTCDKRESSWSIAPMCAGMLPTRTSGRLGWVYVTSRLNKNEFEPTSGPSVSGISCVWGVVPPC